MSPFKFAIPVLGALVLMSAMPGRAEARGRTSFDVSVGFGYSNYNGYGYGNYNNASFRYYNGPRVLLARAGVLRSSAGVLRTGTCLLRAAGAILRSAAGGLLPPGPEL